MNRVVYKFRRHQNSEDLARTLNILAGQLDCPLITFDKAVLKAFPGTALPADEFVTA